MTLPKSKTKIVCTLGPASQSPEVMERMIRAGMNVARLNFSHGDFAGHRKVIDNLRASARRLGRRVAIMADLPGPKIRIGQFVKEPIQLKSGDPFTLTTEAIVGNGNRVTVTFEPLLKTIKPGDTVFFERRIYPARGGESRRERGALPGRGRRRAPVPQRAKPAGNRSRHQRLYRARPRGVEICRGLRGGCGQPILCPVGRGHRGGSPRGGAFGLSTPHHRQDRAFPRPGPHG